MQIEIPCAQCKAVLRVPSEAAGHRARCPACSHQFMVPTVDDILEETVSSWIEEDVEEMIENRSRANEERIAQAAAAAPPASSTAPAAPAAAPENRSRRGRSLWPRRKSQQEALPGGAALPGASVDAHPSADTVTRRRSHAPTRSSDDGHDADGRHDGHDHGDDGHHRHDGRSHKYPRSLRPTSDRPYLLVRRVDAAGVRFAFDSRWLAMEGFRGSMPVRCAFSGVASRAKLIARPIIFTDQLHARGSSEELINAHENRQIGDHTPRRLARQMGTLEHLPEPFSCAMPFFVSTRFAHLSLHARTRNCEDGTLLAEIIIPDAGTALEWLGRVNGVWGPEYELLEADAAMLHGDAWQQLSDKARQRIGVWCKFGPHEVVRQYFNDADFGRHDEGLAGLILTDQRLVFHKYHHSGEVRLDTEDASILARPEGAFINLTLRTGNDLSRMIKLHRNDLDRLQNALHEAGRLDLHVSQ